MTQAIINNDFQDVTKELRFAIGATRFFEQSVISASRVNYFLVSRAEQHRVQSKKLKFYRLTPQWSKR